MVAQKLVEDQGKDPPQTLASLSDEIISAICEVIRRPGGLVSGRTHERGKQISVLVVKNLKLAPFMFKMMEHCSNSYKIKHVNSRAVLAYQHQCELE